MKNRRNRRNRTAGRANAPKPGRNAGRIAVRLWLDKEDFKLLEESTRASKRNRTWQAEFLLENAIRASWAYTECDHRDIPAVTAARDFFAELYHLQKGALEEIQRASTAAKAAANDAARRCQMWLDAEKAHRSRASAGLKVIDGKFRPALKGSAS